MSQALHLGVRAWLCACGLVVLVSASEFGSKSSSAKRSASTPVVQTSLGLVIGKEGTSEDGHRCEEWLGIPFAEPPHGTRRFAPPVPWTRPFPTAGFKATSYAPWCPQLGSDLKFGDEDCLKLNVWRPATQEKDLAVMVWIYGGAFVFGDDGDISEPNAYSGCGLAARHDVIVAGMNYRLGPLGFIALPREGDSTSIEANWGMKDQREALRWVQREIQGFGGNPKRVTIFGESAGAMSVMYHIASPHSKGLFQAAISESGIVVSGTHEFCIHRAQAYAAKLGCNDLASMGSCLRAKTVKDLMVAANETANPMTDPGWGTCVDGEDMPDTEMSMFTSSRASTVPFLAGYNTNEATAFVYPYFPDGLSDTQFHTLVTNVTNRGDPDWDRKHSCNESIQDLIRSKYPVSASTDNRAVASDMMSDMSFHCSTAVPAMAYSKRAKVYIYRFNHRTSFQQKSSTPGVFHAIELPYVFGTPSTWGANFTKEEWELSSRMQTLWTSFAKTSVPVGGTVKFPQFDDTARQALLLDSIGDSIDTNFRGDYCDFWAEIWKHCGPNMPSTYLTEPALLTTNGDSSIYV